MRFTACTAKTQANRCRGIGRTSAWQFLKVEDGLANDGNMAEEMPLAISSGEAPDDTGRGACAPRIRQGDFIKFLYRVLPCLAVLIGAEPRLGPNPGLAFGDVKKMMEHGVFGTARDILEIFYSVINCD